MTTHTATAFAAAPQHEFKRLQEELERLRAENHRLASLAYRDPLTGLRNRRCFSERLDEELRRMRRHGEGSLSLLLIDLNGFKRLNDTRGHAAGDAALVAVGRILEAMVRTEDLVCRLGGDEFAVLLPGTDLAGAEDVEERLRTTVPSLSHTGLSAYPFAVGVAHYLPGDDEASLLERADRDMYRDKRHARIVAALLVAA